MTKLTYFAAVPTISAGPQNTTVYEHDKSSVTLTCNATGDPAPSITWKKDKTQTILARGEQLTLSNVTRKDQGLYICVANNGIGTNASASAMLHVLCKYITQPYVWYVLCKYITQPYVWYVLCKCISHKALCLVFSC